MAFKLEVKRQSYAQMESAEEKGAITLATLQRAAGAMNGELVYFSVPRAAVARNYSELARQFEARARAAEPHPKPVAADGDAAADLLSPAE